jgi:hypothetical protein
MSGKSASPGQGDSGTGTASSAVFAALSVPNFRRYVAGQSLSLIGTWVETVAQALLVLHLTRSGTILGLTTATRYGPILLLSLYAGLLVDRYAKRHILLVTQAGLGLVSTVLGVIVLAGEIRLWQERRQLLLRHRLSVQPRPRPAASGPGSTPASRPAPRRTAVRRASAGHRPASADDGHRRHVHVRVRGEPPAARPHDLPRQQHHVQLAACRPRCGSVHHPAGVRAGLPRPGNRPVVDGPGREHAHRVTHHRRTVRPSRTAIRARPGCRRMLGRRSSWLVARP